MQPTNSTFNPLLTPVLGKRKEQEHSVTQDKLLKNLWKKAKNANSPEEWKEVRSILKSLETLDVDYHHPKKDRSETLKSVITLRGNDKTFKLFTDKFCKKKVPTPAEIWEKAFENLTEAKELLKSINPTHFDINYSPDNEHRGKTLFWLAIYHNDLDYAVSLLTQFPQIDVNTVGELAGDDEVKPFPISAFGLFVSKLRYTRQDYSESVMSMVQRSSGKKLNTLIDPKSIYPLTIFSELVRLAKRTTNFEIVQYILKNFPEVDLNQKAFNGELISNYIARLRKCAPLLLFNSTLDVKTLPTNFIAKNHKGIAPATIARWLKLYYDASLIKQISKEDIYSILIGTSKETYLTNCVLMHLFGVDVIGYASECIAEGRGDFNERYQIVADRLTEIDEAFAKIRLVKDQQVLALKPNYLTQLPEELFEKIFLTAIINVDKIFTRISPKLLLELFYQHIAPSEGSTSSISK